MSVTLAELVASRREELGLSLRQAAEKSGGRVSSSGLHSIERGMSTAITEETVTGLSEALDLTLASVRRAAGLAQTSSLPPFIVPARANRLNMRERKLVLNLIDTLLEAHRGKR